MKTTCLKIAAAVFALSAFAAILYLEHPCAVELEFTAPEPIPAFESKVRPDSLPPANSVLAGDYWEKMTMAMSSMFQLSTIAKMWNATIPIPFTANSYLYGLPDGKLNLDIIYNIDRLLLLAKQFNITVFSTFEQFINSASRKVIGIEVKYVKKQSQLHANVPHHIYNVDCHKDMNHSLLNQLNFEANRRSFNPPLKPFHFVKCCHILAGHDTSPQEISKLCGIHDQGSVTILIKQWRGIENQARFRLYMKQFSTVPYPNPGLIPLPHSTNVIHSSIKLLSSKLTNTQTKFIGVHLRSEKIRLMSRKESMYKRCFRRFHHLIQKLCVKYPGLPVLYVGDSYTNLVFGKKMSRYKIKLTEYLPTQDEGYKAQVEQAFLARAEILILVGGGSFQTQVYKRFQTYNNTEIAHRVSCEEKEKRTLLQRNVHQQYKPLRTVSSVRRIVFRKRIYWRTLQHRH